jgi:hypothetical protein
MTINFFKKFSYRTRNPVSIISFFRGPYVIPKASAGQNTQQVPDDIQQIQEALKKKMNGAILDDSEVTLLKEATSEQIFKATVSYAGTLPPTLNTLLVGDIIKLKFKLKFLSLQKETNKSFVNLDRSKVLMELNSPLKLSPYLEKFITLHYAVTESSQHMELGVLALLFEINLWRTHIKHMTSDLVFLEATQLKIVSPPHRVSKQYSVGGLQSGSLDSKDHSISPKMYSIKLASPFVVGSLDHFVLKLPLISNSMANDNTSRESISGKPIMDLFMNVLAKRLVMAHESDLNNSITVQLVIKSDRADVIATYVAVNSCFNMGFSFSRQTLSFPQNFPLKVLSEPNASNSYYRSVNDGGLTVVDDSSVVVQIPGTGAFKELPYTEENLKKQLKVLEDCLVREWLPENLNDYMTITKCLPNKEAQVNILPKSPNGRRANQMNATFISALRQKMENILAETGGEV